MKKNLALYSADCCKKIDALAIKHYGLTETELIFRAANAAFNLIQKRHPTFSKFIIFSGIGNNGADALALALLMQKAFYQIKVILLNPRNLFFANHHQQLLSQCYKEAITIENFDLKKHQVLQADLIIDGIFGIGLDRAPSGDYKNAIELINASKSKVFSLDIPSGLCTHSGKQFHPTVKADFTLTFIVHKFGLYTADGKDVCGKVFFHSLNLDIDDLIMQAKFKKQINKKESKGLKPVAMALNIKTIKKRLFRRKNNSHKNHFGTALLIGGNHHMAGAITLSCLAALKMGSGLVKVITLKKNAKLLPLIYPEIMSYQKNDFEKLIEQDENCAIAIGPGLGKDDWAQSLFNQVIKKQKEVNFPLIIDADGLNLLAKTKNFQKLNYSKNWTLTPHPKEAARLLDSDVATIQSDRLLTVKLLHQKYGGVIVLKGAGTLIYDGKQTYLCQYGSNAMARGGMGDLLTGMIAGLMAQFQAQNMNLTDAVLIATLYHSYFADIAAKKWGFRSLNPRDIIKEIKL